MYLCCDLGGTKADWAIYSPSDEKFIFRVSKDTNRFEDFYEMMDNILDEASNLIDDGVKIENTTLAIAGPTNHETVNPTNIQGWSINTKTIDSILQDHGFSMYSSIINDFEALGYGVLYSMKIGFSKDDFTPIYGRFKSGPARTGEDLGTRSLVCGPGTGLGVACIVDGLIKDGFPYIFSSEKGHHSLAPETQEQYRLLGRDGTFSGMKSYEDALSRSGLRETYNFFRREDHNVEPNYGISEDEIMYLATNGRDQAAVDTIELFCELLANFCGNSVLSFNCDKAVFLWGGTLKNMPIDLIKARFKRLYSDRCNLDERVSRVPVVLLTNPDLPLLGCVHRSEFELEYLK